MTISLRPLTAENWRECIRIQVSETQKQYVASNVYSIAETRFEPTCVPLTIYADVASETSEGESDRAKMVGFILYDASDNYIARFMIDAQEQGKGYGHAALVMLLEQFARENNHPTATLSFVPGNDIAERLYENVGFRRTGEMEDDEVVMVCLLGERYAKK